jgi:XTP/dITP diphosphohydrolase/ATP diphosphatase
MDEPAPAAPHPPTIPQQAPFAEQAAKPLAEAVAIMARLRGPEGCPWDRDQTFDSIKRHTLEETYEVFDAIERRAWPELKDELGDLLLQVLFYAQMASEAGYFNIADVAAGLNAKLIRRHPHIFPADGKPGGKLADATNADAVLRNWEQIKREEKRQAASSVRRSPTSPSPSAMDDIPRTMPAMLEAAKLGSRAAKAGFDWPNEDGRADGLFAKLQEEIAELRAEVKEQTVGGGQHERVEEELGDLLFTAVNLARHLGIDTESALRRSNAKFRKRFAAMEGAVGGFDALAQRSPTELEALWCKAKQQAAKRPEGPAAEATAP